MLIKKPKEVTIHWLQLLIAQILKWQKGLPILKHILRLKYTKEILTHMLNGANMNQGNTANGT
jgi:hypothetical protein